MPVARQNVIANQIQNDTRITPSPLRKTFACGNGERMAIRRRIDPAMQANAARNLIRIRRQVRAARHITEHRTGQRGVGFIRQPQMREKIHAATASIKPQASAMRALIRLPESTSHAVRCRPMRRAMLTVPPAPGIKPNFSSGN